LALIQWSKFILNPARQPTHGLPGGKVKRRNIIRLMVHGHPHELILNLGCSQTISGFRYVPRQGEGAGRIKDYRIYAGDNLIQK
jgi:hypothetical protein